MFYHGVGIVVSNKHLQEHVYTNELCYALYSEEFMFQISNIPHLRRLPESF